MATFTLISILLNPKLTHKEKVSNVVSLVLLLLMLSKVKVIVSPLSNNNMNDPLMGKLRIYKDMQWCGLKNDIVQLGQSLS